MLVRRGLARELAQGSALLPLRELVLVQALELELELEQGLELEFLQLVLVLALRRALLCQHLLNDEFLNWSDQPVWLVLVL